MTRTAHAEIITREDVIRDIAQRICYVPTLRVRDSDWLDFHQIAVWTLRDALTAAYEAGHRAATEGRS